MLTGCAEPPKETIVVGSKSYTEQDILGNMLTLLIEAHTDLSVRHLDNMASHVIFSAVEMGAVDVYIDYTGTIYGSYLSLSDSNDKTEVYEVSAAILYQKYNLSILGMLGFNNTYGLAVRQETATQFGLQTFSDLAQVSSDLIFGGSAEIVSRYDGLPNLMRVYDMRFKDIIEVHNEERYEAIINNEIQIVEIYTTDGLLYEYDLVLLEDDKEFFPPYHAVVVARNETLEKHPELITVLDLLTGLLPDDVMRSLNNRVDVGGESPRTVAESFLREKGLI